MVQIGANRYGKSEVRVVRVARGVADDGGDVIRDWNVSTALSGDLDDTHLTGDNAKVLPTDSQKNRVFALAKEMGAVPPEDFALALAAFFVASQDAITRARISVEEFGWTPVGATGYSFARTGDLVRTTTVVHDAAAGTSVVSGIKDLTLLNTTGSEFWGFPRDAHTTLAETKDRMLATAVNASWRFRPEAAESSDWDAVALAAKRTILDTFAGTYTYSLQQMLYALGSALISALPEICEVRLALPNKHHFIVDLSPFGLENDREVYYADDRPYGLIEGTVLADDAPDPGLAWT
jgi:urate oxidase